MKNKLYSYMVSVGATLIIGPVVWAVWKWGEDMFPFLVVWLIVHPLIKIWKELGDL